MSDRESLTAAPSSDVVTAPSEDGFYTFVISHAVGKGNANLYKAGCRCGECRAANNDQMKAYRIRRREREERELHEAVRALIQDGIDEWTPVPTVAASVIALVRDHPISLRSAPAGRGAGGGDGR